MNSSTTYDATFAADVRAGLSAPEKHLSSKYLYDARGDTLFQQIMRLDTYYLTRSEYEIFQRYRQDLLSYFGRDGETFQLIEFGAGDGYKTKVLLRHFSEAEAPFTYVPIDISADVLRTLEADLRRLIPDLSVQSICDDYFQALEQLQQGTGGRKVVLFLGSNIGNFTWEDSLRFLQQIRNYLNEGDLLLTGFDLKKDPSVIREAYDDPEGVTRAFNLNLLRRLNETFDANFDLGAFSHAPTYDPHTGEARSYLVSRRSQRVHLDALQLAVDFYPWECIYTEKSQKYSTKDVDRLATKTQFRPLRTFTDERGYYLDALWEAH